MKHLWLRANDVCTIAINKNAVHALLQFIPIYYLKLFIWFFNSIWQKLWLFGSLPFIRHQGKNVPFDVKFISLPYFYLLNRTQNIIKENNKKHCKNNFKMFWYAIDMRFCHECVG